MYESSLLEGERENKHADSVEYIKRTNMLWEK